MNPYVRVTKNKPHKVVSTNPESFALLWLQTYPRLLFAPVQRSHSRHRTLDVLAVKHAQEVVHCSGHNVGGVSLKLRGS